MTSELEAAVKPGMDIAQIQRARLAARSDIERACQKERGPDFACTVIDFNSGARSMLVVHEEYKDVRLVYAPEKQLGYFGGDEMNFRFPRYVSDISILRVKDGVFEVLATNGDTHLGGDDFDRALVDLVVDELRTRHRVDVSGEGDTLQEIRLGVEAARVL